VLPAPRFPETHYDPRVEYVFGHHGSLWRYPLHLLAAGARILRLSRRYRIEGIVFRMGILPIVPLLASFLLRVPLFQKSHSGYKPLDKANWRTLLWPPSPWKRSELRVRLANLLAEPVRAAASRRALVVDCPSLTCRDAVAAQGICAPERLVVVPNAADVSTFRPQDRRACRAALGWEANRKIVGYVGALNRDKRCLDALVRSVAILARTQDVAAAIVGDGPDRPALEALSRAEGVAERVRFVGAVPNREVPRYVGAFDVGVDLCAAPMRVGARIAYASYSQKMAQYLACGLPVVAWDIPDNRMLAEEHLGRLAKFGDVADLARALDAILSLNEPAWEELSARARHYAVAQLSSSALVARRLGIWRTALASAAHGAVAASPS
jgi:glycosyltransferase involved in cell wall biosynthesis